MWQPAQLPGLAHQLKQRGLALNPGHLSSPDDWPLGAVVNLGFCTGSFVSPDGLIVTNHHCASSALQYNSTPQHNLFNDGFLAPNREAELPVDSAQRVYVTESSTDVSEQIHAALKPDMDGYARHVAIDHEKKRLVQQCEQPGYRCDVITFSDGYDYQLIRQKELRDVRLVYAPPSSIGKYGGDVDNWMWPRHSGDFSFLRAYVTKDGKSATSSKDNVAYRPKHWLTLNPGGVQAGDFVMVAGYPAITERHRLADELQSAIDWQYPTTIGTFRDLLAIIKEASEQDPELTIKYAVTVAGINNTLKASQGILDALDRDHALAGKQRLEAQLDQWLDDRPSRTSHALQAHVTRLRQLVQEHLRYRERDLVLQQLENVQLYHSAYQIVRLGKEKQKPDLEREDGFQQRDEMRMVGEQQDIDHQYDPAVDQRILVYLLQRYLALPEDQRLASLDRWLDGAKHADALTRKVAALYEGTALTHVEARVTLLSATSAQIDASKDTWISLMRDLMPDLLTIEHAEKTYEGEETVERAGYMTALVAYGKAHGVAIYHDANRSLRLSFGTVQGYQPRDAVEYLPFTTVDGIAQKNTGIDPFNAPVAELDAIRMRAFDGFSGTVATPLPVNFLANLDITGGNSGSPTLDRRGRLVGLAFDAVWEGVGAGWDFDPKLSRSIHVDVRYMLWVMHHLSHADNLLREMDVKVPQ